MCNILTNEKLEPAVICPNYAYANLGLVGLQTELDIPKVHMAIFDEEGKTFSFRN
jgi:hypothetical protein